MSIKLCLFGPFQVSFCTKAATDKNGLLDKNISEFEFMVEFEMLEDVYLTEDEVSGSNLYKEEVYKLLDEYRSQIGSEHRMHELQRQIESISVESFSDPSIAYRRFPTLMSRLVQPDKISAKEIILRHKRKLTELEQTIVNSMEGYEF